MIFLDKPYVSELLADIVSKNNFSVYKNEMSEELENKGYAFKYTEDEDTPIYIVSENSICDLKSCKDERHIDAFEMAMMVKDKACFREICKNVYPSFFFKSVQFSDLNSVKESEIVFPCIIKPSVGFLSIGVHLAENFSHYKEIVSNLDKDFNSVGKQFSDSVVNENNFIIEQYIQGPEFAVDAYYDDNGIPNIVNIFHHVFKDKNDVSDRCYVTYMKLYEVFADKICSFLLNINSALKLNDFPFHIEFRYDELKGDIFPIEINPLRFTGFCLNDIQWFISGMHPLLAYYKKEGIAYKDMWNRKEKDAYIVSVVERPEQFKGREFKTEKFKEDFRESFIIRNIDDKNFNVSATVFMKTKIEMLDELSGRLLNMNIKKYF